MNKLCVQTPFPNGTVAMKTLVSTNNLSLRVQSNKKWEVSIDQKCTPRRLQARSPQSGEKDMLQTHYIERPALLSQHSRDAKYTIGNIILPLDHSRWNTVEMKSSTSVLSNAIPAGYYFHTMKVQQFTYKHTRLENIYIRAPIDNAIRIRPSAGVFTNASSYGTASAAHQRRLSYENGDSCSNAPKCSQPRTANRATANRATAHSLMRKSSQNRTEDIRFPSH